MATRTIRTLDLRAPEVIQEEAAANRAWSDYWLSILYGKNWHPAKLCLPFGRVPLGENTYTYQSYARLSTTNNTTVYQLVTRRWYRVLRWVACR